MLINGLYLILFVVFTGFMVNRVYVGLTQRQITIKGVTYIRGRDTFWYWFVIAMAVLGFCFGLALSAAGLAALLQR